MSEKGPKYRPEFVRANRFGGIGVIMVPENGDATIGERVDRLKQVLEYQPVESPTEKSEHFPPTVVPQPPEEK